MLCPQDTLYPVSMKDREPTIRSRELGEGLRKAMQYAGFNASEVARQLDWSPGRVSRLLSGKRGGSRYDVTAFLTICGVRGTERERLMALSLDNDRPGWFQQHGPAVPRQVHTLIDHESHATAISDFQIALVPGLLQTGHYARAMMSGSANLPAAEIEDRVSARLARKRLFSRNNPPRLDFFVHEFVLRTPVGGPSVMCDQLHEMLRLSVLPFVSIRVVPAALGAHAAMTGNFTMMEIADFKPITYLDSEISSLFLETPVEIDAYRNILAALEDTALDEGTSRNLMGTVALEFDALREDQDDLADE